jgi:uncharacterized protein (TIGR02284 family)
MQKDQEAAANHLNRLLATSADARRGYRTAARHVGATDMETFFNDRAQQRATFVAKLEEMIRQLGGEPEPHREEEGTTEGTAHRAWMRLHALFAPDEATKKTVSSAKEVGWPGQTARSWESTVEAMLEECRFGNEHTLEEYEAILEKPYVPDHMTTVIEEQMEAVASDIETLEAFKREYEK